MVVYGFTLDSAFCLYGAILFTVIVLITLTADPFKAHLKHLSSSLSVFILFIAVFYVCAIGVDMAVSRNDSTTTYVLFGFMAAICSMPLFYISLLIFQWIIQHCCC